MALKLLPRPAALDQGQPDAEIVRRVAAGEVALFEVLMRRHNARVYHAVRAILRDEDEVEDAMQQTYLQAYRHLAGFNGASSLSTWLTRIAMNEAMMRRRSEGRTRKGLAGLEHAAQLAPPVRSPESQADAREWVGLLERAVDGLPEKDRLVFMLRVVDGRSTAEAADALGITPNALKTRLRRARALLQERLLALAGEGAAEAFAFHARRCDRVVAGVFAALGATVPQ